MTVDSINKSNMPNKKDVIEEQKKKGEVKKLGLTALILMIFTSVFGFANIPRAYLQMGYGAIPWYFLATITYFAPFALIVSEYGAAFKAETGGIFTWMEKSVGPRYAFIATFMWYASYVIWMVNVSSSIWVPISNAFYGTDQTQTWSIFGLGATQTLGLLGILLIIAITFVATKGLENISKITSVGGTAVALLNIALILGAIIVFALTGELAQPIETVSDFVTSPNPAFSTTISVFSFLVFAVFAFGGLEAIGGLVDSTENAEVTFPKGVIISAIVISVGYAIGIFCVGVFTNYGEVLSLSTVNLVNVAYVVMNNLGYQIGIAFNMSGSAAGNLGDWVARFVGLSMFLALMGAFFTLTYSPVKQLIQGTPKEIWPSRFTRSNESGLPVGAMWIQCTTVAVIIALVSFGGEAASAFFDKLVLMTNVAMTIPYMFIAGAFYSFKKNKSIKKSFEVFKTPTSALIASIAAVFTVGFANFFTIIEPAINGDMASTLWSIGGPLFFSIVATLLYNRYEKRHKIK